MHITYDLSVTIEDVLEVKERLARKIYKTGMSRSNYLSGRYKREIFLKFENMQRTGSLRIRDVFNKLSSLAEAERCKGVAACSTGNHAQGVSPSRAMLGIDGRAVMSEGASKSKAAATCDYSAEIVLHGDNFNDTIAEANETAEIEGCILTPPYDDPKVTADQGIIGLETLEDLYDADNVIVLIGDGRLVASIAVVIRSTNPTIKVIGVQPENVHDIVASFHVGEIIAHRTTGTLADGRDVSRPGTLTYEIVRKLVDDIVLVSEDEIRDSIVALIQRNKVVIEGVSVLACAALLSGKLDSYIRNRKTVSIIFGSNIDPSYVSQITGLADA